MSAPPGIDVARVGAWLAEHVPGSTAPLTFTRIGEGQSNLTFRVDDGAGRQLVLRRPPLGEILASAHDVVREHRILTALAPGRRSRCRGRSASARTSTVTGAPFYAMEHVDGIVLGRVADAERLDADGRAEAGRRDRARRSRSCTHVDLDAVGLGDFRRPESLISRQLRRWRRQWEASKTRDLADVEEVAAWLEAAHARGARDGAPPRRLPPPQLRPRRGRRRARRARLGAVHRRRPARRRRADGRVLERAAQPPDGLLPRAGRGRRRLPRRRGARRARTRTRRAATSTALGYWVAFAYWKIAIIIEGVYRRWLNDPQNGIDAGSLAPAVVRLAGLARDGGGRRRQASI